MCYLVLIFLAYINCDIIGMKMCVAQTRPVRGDIEGNIQNHQRLICLAIPYHPEFIIFPELSLTGYEPERAHELASSPEDERLTLFQQFSDQHRLTIGVGLPTVHYSGINISMVLFQPARARQTYSKRYLHPDEEKFFVPGQAATLLTTGNTRIAPAICYELSVPQHARDAFRHQAQIYAVSVAKTEQGVRVASQTLSEIASDYSMWVVMANCVGPSGDGDCAGRSSVWNQKGSLIGQLDHAGEGLLMVDTQTNQVTGIGRGQKRHHNPSGLNYRRNKNRQ